MKGLIDKVVTLYEMRANAMSVLMANTQKALEESEKEGKANEQAERVKSFVKELTMDLNNMVTKFYWFKERKKRRHKEMTGDQVNAVVDFAHFVKSLTRKAGFVLEYFQKSPTFAKKVDGDIKELEAHIKARLRKFDEALAETPDTLAIRLSKYANTLSRKFEKCFERRIKNGNCN